MFIVYTLSTFLLAYLFFYSVSKKLNVNLLTFNIFFILKFLYLLLNIYSHYNNFGSDAIGYYNNSDKYDFGLLPITDNLIYGINYFFKIYFNLNFETLNIITFFISFSSCMILLYLVKDFYYLQKFSIYLVLLFPSFNFFTSGLNKDMLVFFGLSLFLLSLVNKNNFLLILSILLILLVRPYVCFAILFAFTICFSLFFLKQTIINLKINIKFFSIYLLCTIISIFIIYFILNNQLGSFGKYFLKGNIEQIINNLQLHYVNTTLGIPIDTNIISRLFNYVFFPVIWQSTDFNLFYIILKTENIILLFISIYFIYNFKINKIDNFYLFFGISSFLILFLILGLVTSNYGIAFRQKWMFVPFLLVIISKKLK